MGEAKNTNFNWRDYVFACGLKEIFSDDIGHIREESDVYNNQQFVLCKTRIGSEDYWPASVEALIKNPVTNKKSDLVLKWWNCSCKVQKEKCKFQVNRSDPRLATLNRFVTFQRPCPWRPTSQMIDAFWKQKPKCFFLTGIRARDQVRLTMLDNHDLMPGMMVECVHPVTRASCHAAFVEEVLNPHQARIRIDSQTAFVWDCTDLTVMTVGTCLKMGVFLHPPSDAKPEDFHQACLTVGQVRGDPPEAVFSWRLYLSRAREKRACFKLPRIDTHEAEGKFEVGAKLEVRVDSEDKHLCCATVCKVANGLLFLFVDSMPRFPLLILPVDSEDVFPTSWAADHGISFIPPATFVQSFDHLANNDLPSIFVNPRCLLGSRLALKKIVEGMPRQTPESRNHLFWQDFLIKLLKSCQNQVPHQQCRSKLAEENFARRAALTSNPFWSPPSDCPNLRVSLVYDKNEPLSVSVPVQPALIGGYLLRLCLDVFETCPYFLTLDAPGPDSSCPNKCYLSYRSGKLRKLLDRDSSFIKRQGKPKLDGSSISNRSSHSSSAGGRDQSRENSPPVHHMTTRGKRAAYADLSGKRTRRSKEPRLDESKPRVPDSVKIPDGTSTMEQIRALHEWRDASGHAPSCSRVVNGERSEEKDPEPTKARESASGTEGDVSSEDSVDESMIRRRSGKRAKRSVQIPSSLPADLRQWSPSDVATFARYNDCAPVQGLIEAEQIDGKAALLCDKQLVLGGIKEGCPRCLKAMLVDVLIYMRAIYNKRFPTCKVVVRAMA